MKRNWRKAIALIEIIGGLSGIGLTFYVMINTEADVFTKLLFGGLAFAPFLISIVAGLLLWRNHAAGAVLSMIVQAVQVPKFSFPGVMYLFYSGVDAGTLLTWPGPGQEVRLHFAVNFGGNVRRHIGEHEDGLLLGLNIFALFAFFYLLKLVRSPSNFEKTGQQSAEVVDSDIPPKGNGSLL